MTNYEQQYYEAESFWAGEMLRDEANLDRVAQTANLVPKDVKTLIDVGCGNGVFVNHLMQTRPELNILAIDRSQAALKFVKTNKETGDITHLKYGDESYDCVTCLEVLEHLPVPVFEESLYHLSRISRKYLIVSVPYNENLEESFNQCPQCKTIFNRELHLRSFSDGYFTHLFDNYGFTNLNIVKMGMSVHFKGHYEFRKLFYKEQFRQWQSPVCPVCGHSEELKQILLPAADNMSTGPAVKHRKPISYLTYLPKLIWPKEKKYYWIMGLFMRKA